MSKSKIVNIFATKQNYFENANGKGEHGQGQCHDPEASTSA